MEGTPEDERALVDRLQRNGWEAAPISCYGEGVEGWRWTHTSESAEYEELGVWDELPRVPDALRQRFG